MLFTDVDLSMAANSSDGHPYSTKNIKVGFMGTRGYPSSYGGFETAVKSIAPFLSESGMKVSVFCRKSSDLQKMNTFSNGIEQKFTLGINSQSLSTLSYGFTSMLSSILNRIDVLIVMNVANGFFLPFLKFFKIKTIVNVDGIEWERAKWNRFGRKIFFLGAKLTAKFADEIVCDSEEIACYWKRVFRRESTYIPYGVEVSIPEDKIYFEFQKEKFVLYLARLVPENSILEFLSGIEFLPQEIQIVIVGSTKNMVIQNRLNELMASRKKVQLLGHINDPIILHSIWSKAHVYFHGHTVGGTNPTLVQSLFYRLRIVAIDSPYNIEVAQENALYTSKNPRELASTILNAYQNLERPEIDFPRKFTWEDVSKKYLDLVKKCLS